MSDITFLNASGAPQSAGAISTAGGLLTPYYAQERFVVTTGALSGMSTSPAYSIGDAIGPVVEFQNVRKADGGVVVVRQLAMAVNDVAIGTNSIDAWVYTAAPAAATDNVAYAPNWAASGVYAAGKVTLSSALVGSGWGLYRWNGELYLQPSATSVFAVFVANAGFTFTVVSERRCTIAGDHG